MDAVTYPEKSVIEFMNGSLVPLRVRHDSQPLATDFNVKWTPTLVVLDADGKEHHRGVGFQPAEELIPFLLLGIAKQHFDLNELDQAIASLTRILSDFPNSGSAPEAIFLQGVNLYKKTNDPSHLKAAYEKLTTEYPSSEWTKRALPYRLL